jgi:predicted nucleic acid-binding protein
VKYLLDVNVLLALLFNQHEFHGRVESWVSSLQKNGRPHLATCPLTELGCVRIASGVGAFGVDVVFTKNLLQRFKQSKHISFSFIADSIGVERLPDWTKKSRQTTDGYLKALADEHGYFLATLDKGIPGAFLIP